MRVSQASQLFALFRVSDDDRSVEQYLGSLYILPGHTWLLPTYYKYNGTHMWGATYRHITNFSERLFIVDHVTPLGSSWHAISRIRPSRRAALTPSSFTPFCAFTVLREERYSEKMALEKKCHMNKSHKKYWHRKKWLGKYSTLHTLTLTGGRWLEVRSG